MYLKKMPGCGCPRGCSNAVRKRMEDVATALATEIRWRPAGTMINAGKDEVAKAIQLIKEGKPIKYPRRDRADRLRSVQRHHRPRFRLWRIQDGEIITVGQACRRTMHERHQGEDRQPGP